MVYIVSIILSLMSKSSIHPNLIRYSVLMQLDDIVTSISIYIITLGTNIYKEINVPLHFSLHY